MVTRVRMSLDVFASRARARTLVNDDGVGFLTVRGAVTSVQVQPSDVLDDTLPPGPGADRYDGVLFVFVPNRPHATL